MTKLTKPVSQMKNVKLYGADDPHVMVDGDGNTHLAVHNWMTTLMYGDCVCKESGCPFGRV